MKQKMKDDTGRRRNMTISISLFGLCGALLARTVRNRTFLSSSHYPSNCMHLSSENSVVDHRLFNCVPHSRIR